MMSANLIETIPLTEEDTQKDKYLSFYLSQEVFAIEIKYVTEIIGMQPITEVPELPLYIKGIINLRGKIIPVLDVRLRFNKPPKEYNDRTCIIVVDIKDILVGFIVDSVSEVLSILPGSIVPPPLSSSGFNSRYIKGIGKVEQDVKLIIDCDKMLSDKEMIDLENTKLSKGGTLNHDE